MTVQHSSSTESLKAALFSFLTSGAPGVFCIHGPWGVGKTYLWNATLMQAKAANKIALHDYSYVSLFGVQSLEELKYSIFESSIKTSLIGTEPNLETFTKNYAALTGSLGRRVSARIFEVIPILRNGLSSFQMAAFLSVSKQLICLDDIERKGQNLRVVDIMGLASLLVGRRNCQVVVILNDGQLDPADAKTFARFHEKVIDRSFVFSPSSEEACAIALSEPAQAFDAQLTVRAISLGITNIRVIRKIRSLIASITQIISNYHTEISKQAVSTLVLFGSLYFSRTEDGDTKLMDYALNHRCRREVGRN